jgi:glycosyltransferase involved in cell wall biosynthesis
MAREIWYWEKMCSPHKAGMLVALARAGCHVTYVVQESVTSDRAQQGWSAPTLTGVQLRVVASERDVERLVLGCPRDVIHLCDGIRANGLVTAARHALRRHHRPFWVFMETIDDAGWRGMLKRAEYRRLLMLWRQYVKGVLAVGERTPEWVRRRGYEPTRIYPFAYFLPLAPVPAPASRPIAEAGRFRFVYVGQFIPRKRVDMLIDCLAAAEGDFELVVVGTGPLESNLHAQGESKLPGRVKWIGRLPMHKVLLQMAEADCLVLPSRHDGWGGVISEALMVGTPVICSDACGAAVAVRASDAGGVFRSADPADLQRHLERVLHQGRWHPGRREPLARWAACLGADSGADYLLRILEHAATAPRPPAPWEATDPSQSAGAVQA